MEQTQKGWRVWIDTTFFTDGITVPDDSFEKEIKGLNPLAKTEVLNQIGKMLNNMQGQSYENGSRQMHICVEEMK